MQFKTRYRVGRNEFNTVGVKRFFWKKKISFAYASDNVS